ncbi:NuA4 histone acetyltransferase subunit [Friedmanniomyces endolithicus]|uniref:NuA4 histone acetyltransferase subunit n=1 Tax=Friedmanniomyces endolithicus TaxID=329885 RepID=A0AAN6FTP8_9PEZI|nr:NuA4 histone acetyltransferase subunit [Friedmanniomyces endolithicus]KAK0293767.1 NuA4 histone acetyltransferase subunit [Friedmanniomyces endolithicus]KAK0324282.1 NuA4 histone acetyltransferase subunit [Friedmanniomyces endolithicus]KAK0985925.1 Actin-related protein 4 [Friedmanniomyces endolithicus]
MASALPTTQAPLKDEYGGDEINALVLDAGSYSIRAGFAGEDTPKSVMPSYYGLTTKGERLFGENAVHLPRRDMEIKNPYDTEGVVEDWETASRLWEYSITSRLTGARQTSPFKNGLNDGATKDGDGDVPMEEDLEKMEDDERDRPLEEYPLLMSEPGWNTPKARERTIEIAMESWGVPAFFLAKNGQLAAYGNGKATALVVDVGHQNTSVTAIWEGMVLRKSMMHSPLAGSFLNDQIRMMFAGMQPPVPLTPHYMVKSKAPVDAGVPSAATYMKYADPPKESYRRLEEDRVLTSFKESVVQAWSGPGRLDSNLEAGKLSPPRPFEMPDGWNQVFGIERYRVAEGYFDTKSAYTDAQHAAPKSDDSIPSLVHRALNNCDVDTRAALLANVILTGAGSLIEKLPERLQGDLQVMYPNPRVRVLANPSSVERKYGAWIGGSVLASLGTFHQMWISREEYKEYGPSLVEKRCK